MARIIARPPSRGHPRSGRRGDVRNFCGPHGAAWSSFTSWVISRGRNFGAKHSTKSLFADRPPNALAGRRHHRTSRVEKLVDRTGIALEITDKLLVLSALKERREADLLIELQRRFVERHRRLPHRSVRRSLRALSIAPAGLLGTAQIRAIEHAKRSLR